MRNTPYWWVIIGFMVLLDIYFFQAIKVVSDSAPGRIKTIIYVIYWVLSIAAVTVLLILPYLHFERKARFFRTTIFAMIAGLFFAKLVAAFFFLIDDIRRVVQWGVTKLSSNTEGGNLPAGEGNTRSSLISWAGMLVGGALYGSLIYGFGNKYRYKVKRVKLSYNNLPAAFRGLKIVHISDIHAGSLGNKNAVIRGVSKIMKENPDLILFTGDLVNNVTDEMEDYMDVFDKLKAPLGVYAVLGNHDYGDYIHWKNIEEKKSNLERMKQVHVSLGWRLLMNEHIILEKGTGQIAVIGIENWSSKARFHKYGDLKKAYTGSEAYPFKILLSHDPSHWKAEVVDHYPDIDLMLSGHTHGMQFGVEIAGFKWSPVQYIYKEWAGLYEKAAQKLYVNRGFGFIGYPGRVGVLPEITVLELS